MSKAITIDSGNAGFYRNLGMLYQDIGDIDRARSFYKKAMELEPGYQQGQASPENLGGE